MEKKVGHTPTTLSKLSTCVPGVACAYLHVAEPENTQKAQGPKTAVGWGQTQLECGEEGCLGFPQRAQSRALQNLDPLAGRRTPLISRICCWGWASVQQSPYKSQHCRGGASPSCFTAWRSKPDRQSASLAPGLVLKSPTKLPHTRAGRQ